MTSAGGLQGIMEGISEVSNVQSGSGIALQGLGKVLEYQSVFSEALVSDGVSVPAAVSLLSQTVSEKPGGGTEGLDADVVGFSVSVCRGSGSAKPAGSFSDQLGVIATTSFPESSISAVGGLVIAESATKASSSTLEILSVSGDQGVVSGLISEGSGSGNSGLVIVKEASSGPI